MHLSAARVVKGFTLIELMVSIAIVAILLALATPSFVDYFERYRLRSAVDDTLNLYAAARQGAVEADRNVRVTFASSTSDWCVGGVQQTDPVAVGDPVPVSPAACDCGSTPAGCSVNGATLVASEAGRDVTIGSGGTDLTFDSKNGTLNPLGTAEIDFFSSTQRYGLRVQVSALGQARACVIPGKRAIPGYSPC